jgi:primary-amine oxidase
LIWEERFMLARTAMAGFSLVLLTIAPVSQDTKVYDTLSVDDVGQVLNGFKIKYEQRADAKQAGRYVLHYDHKGQPITLFYLHGGKSLMLQTAFAKTTLEKVNAWNDAAVFSRAYVGVAGSLQDKAVLEWSLDTDGPVTASAVQRFIRGFGKEVDHFATFLGQPLSESKEEQIKPVSRELANELTKLELEMHKLMQQLIPDDNTMVMTFPVGDEEWKTAWKVTWDISTISNERGKKNNFFRIVKASFKTGPSEPWLQVLGDARVSEIFTAYSDGKTRYHDMRDFEFPMMRLSPKDAGIRGRIIGPDKKVAAEIRERGVLWASHASFKDFKQKGPPQLKSRRGQELVLWAALNAGNYDYLIQYGFQDDGTVTFRAGASAFNLGGRTDVSHVHNACWRINVNLGGTGKNTVYVVTHEELEAGGGKAKQSEKEVAVEGPGEWKPKEFTFLRVKHLLEQKVGPAKEISYDLLPLRQGSARHHGKGEEFTHHDYWVTPNVAEELFYYNLPKYIANNKADPRSTVNTDVALWYMSSSLHIPRSEDGHIENGTVLKLPKGVALTAWTGFDLRPRNVFAMTPLYP